MAEISCPMCGKPNPAELDVCQYCEARLKPLTDELSRSQPPIRPGEEPMDMDTGQLEPILPQWLREIRQQARDSAEESAGQAPSESEAGQSEEPTDLLAGLRSQSDADEEIPDWLAGLRGEAGEAGFDESSTEEDDLAALKSMLGQETPAVQESEEASALPGWVSDLGAGESDRTSEDEGSTFVESRIEEPGQAESQPPASSADFGWTADFETDSGLQAESAKDETPFETDLPTWLKGVDETSKGETESGLPAWMTEEPTPGSESETALPADAADLPGWLASLGEEDTGEVVPPQDSGLSTSQSTTGWLASLGEEPVAQEDTGSAAQSTTGWLASLGEEPAEATSQQEIPQPAIEGGLPDWLSSPGEESPEVPSRQETGEPIATGDLPDWLASLGEESREKLPQEQGQPFDEGEAPDWLSSFGKESFAQEEEIAPGAISEALPLPAEAEVPDWLATMGEATAEAEQPAGQLEAMPFTAGEPTEEAGATPTFVDDEGKPISTEDVEAIFSMDMPDWLSDTRSPVAGETAFASAEAQEDELRPVDLPSWVQAMRPVESVISETEEESAEEQPLEERGPLAGLRGVLPAMPGVGPSSKPKAYSIKLQASEDQQSSAALLEQMLAEEIHPKPVSTQKTVLSQRLLRWAIAVLLLLAVIVGNGTRINPISTNVPLETSAALKYIQETLPADAPVLVIFDYEAALAGELEATAAPLVDQMLTFKHPRLSLLSSTPMGTGLAERFMKLLQTDREYARNKKFVNLGYLPGGAAGVQTFARDPAVVKQFTTTGELAWVTPVLQDVSKLSNFAAILLLTDDVETARIWIEQTENERGEARMLVVSSAQSGPMILPYVRSGQVDGMVTGLDGSAPIEQANSGRPGMVRRYWDAYGFGMLMAIVLTLFGSLWSLVSGWQARRKEQGVG